jgi:predicted flap endonuclease-1-like 5' DNA nuclease
MARRDPQPGRGQRRRRAGFVLLAAIAAGVTGAAALAGRRRDRGWVKAAPRPVTSAPEPLTAIEPAPTVEAPAVEVPVTDDDLTVIDGIGPKIAAALRGSGVRTFESLAATPPATLREILATNGMRLAPTLETWPAQAAARTRQA